MGKMTDREKHIKNLSCIMDSMPDDACGDWRDSLAYAISSLKTDEAYQIMYEGGEIFTKDDMVDMLEDLKKEMNPIKECEYQIYGKEHWNFVGKCQDVIQQKIDALKDN